MSAPEKMRVAMVGVGGFGATRRKTMRNTGLFDIVAVYDHSADNLAQAAQEEEAQAVASYEGLLATPDIEAMIISTGGKFHAEQAVAAAERGLHVFVEKPLCSTPEEVRALLDAQKRTGVVMGVGHADHSNSRTSRTIKRLLEDGTFGTLTAFETTTCHCGGLLMKPGDWRADPERNPGGMLFQCGVHSLHELMYYFGPVREVSAMMRYDVHTSGTADASLCLLRFSSGMLGTLNAYHVCGYRHTLSIFGTGANLYREDRFFDEGTTLELQIEDRCGAKQPLQSLTPDDVAVESHGEVRSFYRAVREGGVPYPSLLDGARAVSIVFAADQSAHGGSCAVALPEDII